MFSQTVQALVASAFREIAVYTAVMPVPADDLAFGLDKFNRLLDESHNDRRLTYSEDNPSFVLTPLLQPHTIGPSASSPTFVVTNRPIEIRTANIIMTDVTPNVYVPVEVVSYRWWSEEVPVRAVNTTLPRYLYYKPDWPVGSIFLWPVPTLAYTLELWTRSSVFFNGTGSGGTWLLTDTFSVPPGYTEWLTLKLAVRLAPSYPGAIVSPELKASLVELEQKLFNTNADIPALDLNGAGTPGGDSHETFNYRSRTF